MKRFLLPMFMVFAIAALLMGTAPAADANMVLYLDDASTAGIDIIIVDDFDGGVGTPTSIGNSNTADGTAGGGIITFNAGFGTWVVNVTTGLSKDVIGGVDVPKLDLNSVNVSGARPGVLTIGLTDTDFVVPGQETGLTLTNLWGGTTNGSVIAQGQLGDGNAEFEADYVTPVQGPFGPGAFSDTVTAFVPAGALVAGAPFSLTEIVTITHTAAGQVTSFDKELNAVPEPGTMLLIGTGLIGLAGLGRRKLRKK